MKLRTKFVIAGDPSRRNEAEAKDDSDSNTDSDADSELSKQDDEDDNLPLNFQERSLREFVHGESATQQTCLCTPPFFAHLDLFLTTAELLCAKKDAPEREASVGLHNYAAFSWLRHFLDLDEAEKTAEEAGGSIATKEQIVSVIESLYRVMRRG